MISLAINKGGSGKNTWELKGAIVFHTQQVQNYPAPSLISNEQSLGMDGNTRDTFIYRLNNKDKNFILNVAKFMTACFELRKIFSNCNLI